jgi:hypothetical protein
MECFKLYKNNIFIFIKLIRHIKKNIDYNIKISFFFLMLVIQIIININILFPQDNGNSIIPVWYQEKRDGKYGYGYMEEFGLEKISKPIFDEAYYFKEGLALVKINGKYGYINKKMQFVIPSKFEDAYDFCNGLALVKMDNKYGYINKTGNEVIIIKYDSANDFSEGFAAIKLYDKWGYINTTGKEIIPFIYDYAYDFNGGFGVVKINENKYCIDKEGNLIEFSKANLTNDGIEMFDHRVTWVPGPPPNYEIEINNDTTLYDTVFYDIYDDKNFERQNISNFIKSNFKLPKEYCKFQGDKRDDLNFSIYVNYDGKVIKIREKNGFSIYYDELVRLSKKINIGPQLRNNKFFKTKYNFPLKFNYRNKFYEYIKTKKKIYHFYK